MRIAIAAVVAAAVAGLGFTADAAPARKKQQKYSAAKERVQAPRASRSEQFGFDNSPEHYPTGSSQWWRAMEREGRGGFGDTM